MSATTTDSNSPHAKALDRCEKSIQFYEKAKRRQRFLDYVFQTLTIGMAGVTPLFVMIDFIPNWGKALPAVLATIAAGLNAVFRFRTNYVNFAYAGERLKAEKLKFEVLLGSSDKPTKADVEQFIERVEEVVLTELTEWRDQLLRADTAASMREAVELLSKRTLNKALQPTASAGG